MLESGVDIEKFRLFVANLFPPGTCIPPSATKLTEVFEAITRHGLWNSLHCSPLVQIAEHFGGGDPDMESWIQNYEKDLKAHTIVATIEGYIESGFDTCTLQSQVDSAKYDLRYNCPVEWKIKFHKHTIQYLIDVWKAFSNRYLVPDSPPTCLLDHIRKGCLSVTWLVPSYLIPQLVKKAKADITFFQEYHILKVTVGGKVVYEKEVTKETKTTEVSFK